MTPLTRLGLRSYNACVPPGRESDLGAFAIVERLPTARFDVLAAGASLVRQARTCSRKIQLCRRRASALDFNDGRASADDSEVRRVIALLESGAGVNSPPEKVLRVENWSLRVQIGRGERR